MDECVVYRLRFFLFVVWMTGTAPVGAVEGPLSSLQRAEPAYVQAVAPRFADWILQNYGPESAPSSVLRPLFLKEAAKVNAWLFEPAPDFWWPRLQFGARWEEGHLTDTYVLIFPLKAEGTWTELDKNLRLPPALKSKFLGFGFSLKTSEFFIFNLETGATTLGKLRKKNPTWIEGGVLRRTTLAGGKTVRTDYLVRISEPASPPMAFFPLVRSWRSWVNEQGEFLHYELFLDKFNMRFLDGAALGMARKFNQEFLLNNLRINYRTMSSYDLLYP